MPFVWDVARYCLELPYGAVRHFPAGTYNEQVATWAGRTELDLMSTAHSAWYMFRHMSMSDWGEDELRFSKWMMPTKPRPEPPTRRMDWILEALWAASPWAAMVLDNLRGASGG